MRSIPSKFLTGLVALATSLAAAAPAAAADFYTGKSIDLLIGAPRTVDHEPSFLFGRALSRSPVGFPIHGCLGGEKRADDHEERYQKS